jgi:hypothetical protein
VLTPVGLAFLLIVAEMPRNDGKVDRSVRPSAATTLVGTAPGGSSPAVSDCRYPQARIEHRVVPVDGQNSVGALPHRDRARIAPGTARDLCGDVEGHFFIAPFVTAEGPAERT